MRASSSRILFLTGCLLISTIAMVLIISSLGFFAGLGIASWQFPAAFILTGVFYFYAGKSYYKDVAVFTRSFLISIAIIIISIIVAVNLYDVSYDGQSYHMEGIYQLKNGWNPFKNLLPETVNFSIYINHYPKGVELPQSTIYSLVNHIEAAKATNFMLLGAAFCLVLSFLLSLKKLSNAICVLLTLLATLNPIVVNQLISTYVDGQLAVLLLCFFIAAVWIVSDPGYDKLILLGSIIIIEANVKFTGLVYMVFFSAALLAWLLFAKRTAVFKKVFYTALIAGFIAVIVVGYNPYVMNTVKFQHPFYPLMGAKKVDIIGYNLPNGFDKKTEADRFFTSLFAHTDNPTSDNEGEVELKIPLTLNKTDLVNASKIDTRIAGFGPLFSGIILLAVALLFILLLQTRNRKILKNSAYFIAVILVSVAIIPESWWARYIPQLWYVPVIIVFITELASTRKLKVLKTLIYLAFILNISFTFIGIGWNVMMTSLVNHQLEKLRAANQTIKVEWGSAESNRIRFQENHIPFIEQNLDHVPGAENIIRSDSKFIIPANTLQFPQSTFIQWAQKYQQAVK